MSCYTSTWVFSSICVSRLTCWCFLCFCNHWNTLILTAVILLLVIIIMFWISAVILFLLVLHVWWAASLSWVAAETMCMFMEWWLWNTCSASFVDYLGSAGWISRRADALEQYILVNHLSLGSLISWYHRYISNWIMMAVYYHFSNTRHLRFLKLIMRTNGILLCLTQMMIPILVMLTSKTTKPLYLMQVLPSPVLSLSFLLGWSFANSFVWLDGCDAHRND